MRLDTHRRLDEDFDWFSRVAELVSWRLLELKEDSK
jgi:hypothetical protein